MSGEKTPEEVTSKSVGTGDGSAVWCWTESIEAEVWHGRHNSREAAIAAARHDATLEAQPEGFWVAPTITATEVDVNDWMGDEDIEVGDPIIDVDNIEHFPPNVPDVGRAGNHQPKQD